MLGKALTTAAAGNAGEATYVEDVFSTYLYEGTDPANQTITNGIDLDGEGGMVWIKDRGNSYDHAVYDTERGIYKYLETNNTGAETSNTTHLRSFNSDGFQVGVNLQINGSGNNYASWTFRKAPKFFDVVTYTGNGTAGRTVSHNLGSVPGAIIVKRLNATVDWAIYHRGVDATNPQNYWMKFNTDAREDNLGLWYDTAPTSTEFTVGNSTAVNNASGTYVAYLFAHNDGDGEFGKTGDQDIIKCGSYLGNGSANGPEIDLGFEPQWLLMKDATTANLNNWFIFDVMRGIVTGGNDTWLEPNSADADNSNSFIDLTPTGFKITTAYDGFNENAATYIYIAIRRGPMKTPESGTEVFAPAIYSGTDVDGRLISSGFPVDSAIIDPRNGYATPGGPNWFSRLTGNGRFLQTAQTSAELDGSSNSNGIMGQDGITVSRFGTNVWSNVSGNTYVSWFLRRAPGFFDVVATEWFSGPVNHNLSAVPELIIFKERASSNYWYVWHKDFTNQEYIFLDQNYAKADYGSQLWATQTETTGGGLDLGASGAAIMYLFASLPGVSKVGSYTGNGTSQTIDCGFSNGARFVLIKRTDNTDDWHVYDSERGIVAGNDPRLELNTTDVEDTGSDDIDPVSSGFSVTSDASVNTNNAEYIFLAIA